MKQFVRVIANFTWLTGRSATPSVKTWGAYRVVIKDGKPQLKIEEKFGKIKQVVYIKPGLNQSDAFEVKEK